MDGSGQNNGDSKLMAFDAGSYTRRSRGFTFDNVTKTFKISGGTAGSAASASEFAGTDDNNFALITASATVKEDLGLITASSSADIDLGGLSGDEINASELTLPSYTVAAVPTASASTSQVIFVSNETGGATLAFSDGTNWRRLQDLAIISA